MDETNQTKSTAVAEVPLMNGEVNKGPVEEPETQNGLEQTDEEMNGETEPVSCKVMDSEPCKATDSVSSKATDSKQSKATDTELTKAINLKPSKATDTEPSKAINLKPLTANDSEPPKATEEVQKIVAENDEKEMDASITDHDKKDEQSSEQCNGNGLEPDDTTPEEDKTEVDVEPSSDKPVDKSECVTDVPNEGKKDEGNTGADSEPAGKCDVEEGLVLANKKDDNTDNEVSEEQMAETSKDKTENTVENNENDVEENENAVEESENAVEESENAVEESENAVEENEKTDEANHVGEPDKEVKGTPNMEDDVHEEKPVSSVEKKDVEKSDDVTDNVESSPTDVKDTNKKSEDGDENVSNTVNESESSVKMADSKIKDSSSKDTKESQEMQVDEAESEKVLKDDILGIKEIPVPSQNWEESKSSTESKPDCDKKLSKESNDETIHESSTAVKDQEKKTEDSPDKTQSVKPVTDSTGKLLMESEANKTLNVKQVVKVSPKSNSKFKSKTLDQVLSKITSIAESESQQKAAMETSESTSESVPKKAKARKSCAPVKPPVPSPVKPPITSLTFNVKDLEKRGLIDLPKAQKRKAFEPMKIKTEVDDGAVVKTNGNSKLKSPVRSPGKNENPFFNNKKKKLMKRKKGKRGGYKLPGERSRRKNKKNEMETSSGDCLQENIVETANCDTISSSTQKQFVEMSESLSGAVSPPINAFYQSGQGKSLTAEQNSQQKNILNVLTKTNRSLTSTPSNSAKKAKKSVKSVDSMRRIDSFFKGERNASPGSKKPQSPNSVASVDSTGSKESDVRKRKAPGTIPSSPILTPEEKKRRLEEGKSPKPPPPQMITLVPTGGSPLGMSKLPGSPAPILLAPGSGSGHQAIIQNGTLNGLPMFQIVSGPNIATTQPQQLVGVGASQGQSLLQNSFPRTTTLLQSNRMPVILAPVSVQAVANGPATSQVTLSSAVISQGTLVSSVASSIHGTRLVSISNMLAGHPSDAVSAIPQTKVYLSNGQLLDSKLIQKNGSLPNGLYPVTPPKTPENNGALDSKDSIELSPGGTPLPDKDVIPLCTCKITGANFQKLASLVTYCQALDSVDGKAMGCCNKVTGTQMVRPAVKVPFLSLCEAHRKRLRMHQCCPGCGHFCTQGKFLQCKKDSSNSLHLFHEQCLVVRDGKNYCPHCGETSAHMEVQLFLEETKPTTMKETKSSRVQTKARFTAKTAKTASSTEETVEESAVQVTLEKTKKTISTSHLPFGPDRHSLEKVLSCLGQERPKKFRHLPKCLYTPAYDQDLERTLYMLEDGHDPNEKYGDLECQSALHAAATVGSLPVVHVLMQAGASPHVQDKTLRTPLMYAAENNHLDVVKYLIKAGSTIDSKADDGMTALHYAAKAGHVEVLRILLDSERVTVDVTDDGGWTPLIWAVEHDQIDSVKLLLKRNADPNLRDTEENTTLHWAAFSGSVVIAELLLMSGCDLDSLNMHGDRPLHIAARQDHYECVVLFLARGADVDAKNNKVEAPEECCLDKTSTVYSALKVNRQLKKFGAKHMSRPEKLLHRDLSKGRENIPIPCVNAVDDDGIPQDYLYVTDNIETTSLHVNRVIGSLQSCQCKDDCSSIYCACGKNSLRCWYDKFGRLIPEFNTLEPPLIFECNRACACWTTCNNRVVQNGVMSRLQVFKTEGRGWGCKTLVEIPRGTFICEYIGEHISDSEADSREDDSYLFDLDNRDGETYCIDARKYGNIARFINHLCEPNLVPVKVFVDSQDLRFPRICLFASRDILAGQELGFDYGEKFWIIKYKQFTCTCGSQKCRYSKDTIQKTLEEYHLRHDDEEAEVVTETQQTN